MGRAILAVAAGFVLWSVLWLLVNAGLAAAMPDAFRPDGTTDSTGILLTILGLSIVCSIASGYVTALVAREPGVARATVLGVVLLVVGIAVQAGSWELLPVWYHLTFLVALLPAAVLGGKLRAETRAQASAA